MKLMQSIAATCANGERFIGMATPSFDLVLRTWVAKVFFMSGLTKIQSWQTTLMLFEYEYEVPLLSPLLAAWLGTAAELILPIFLLLGFLGRPMAMLLFIFNAVAVLAYSSFLFGEEGAAGLQQHVLWGVMLLVTVFHGPGKLSVDAQIARRFGASA